MDSAMHRHDISDHAWSLLAPLLPGRRGDWGGRAKDNRLFVNAIFWILRTGAPWRDLPPEYGGWKNTHRRFCRWRDKGTWEHVLANPMDMPDFEWLMIDSTYCKVHAHAAGAKDGNQDMSRTKGAQHENTSGRVHWWQGNNQLTYRNNTKKELFHRVVSIFYAITIFGKFFHEIVLLSHRQFVCKIFEYPQNVSF